jgi:ATP-binding protein involved in chromosome partitioning
VHGIKIMSMGYLVPPDQAVIWRGPMAQKYVKEFLERGNWGELDCLIVDLPPGTGDIPLTLAQSIPLTGAVIVCTPQDVALLDAVKALRMYQKLGVEPLGMVENMSYHVCPQCGHREETFGHGGAEEAARKLGVPFLGGIPLNVSIRRNGDAGSLIENFTKSDAYVSEAIEHTVARLIEELEARQQRGTPLPQLKIDG